MCKRQLDNSLLDLCNSFLVSFLLNVNFLFIRLHSTVVTFMTYLFRQEQEMMEKSLFSIPDAALARMHAGKHQIILCCLQRLYGVFKPLYKIKKTHQNFSWTCFPLTVLLHLLYPIFFYSNFKNVNILSTAGN